MTPDLSNLKFFILCQSTLGYRETIAAFDCEPPAVLYLAECRKVNPRFDYQLVDHQGKAVQS